MSVGGERPLPRLRDWLVAHLVVVLLIFVFGVVAFAVAAGRLDNAFAEAARRDHLGLVLRTQLGFLPAYLFVWLLHALVSWPAARRLQRRGALRRGRGPGRPRLLLSAFLWSVAIFLVSFGPMSYVGTGSLDTLARVVAARVSPAIDVYAFLDWRLREVFTLVFLGLIALGVVDVLRWLDARVRSWSMLQRALLGLAIGLVPSLALGGVLAARATPPPRDVVHPNVIVLATDSLRWDHLSCHGYARPTSPHIDAFAEEAVDFDQMHVATASTLESWTSFLTGRWPANHGLRYMFATREQVERVSEDPGTLPRVLRDLGYESAVVGDWAANSFSLVDYGFDHNHTSEVQNLDVFLAEVSFRTHLLVPHYFTNPLGELLVPHMKQVTGYADSDGIVRRFLRSFDGAAGRGRPFFGVLFLSCTHLPFATPHPYNRMFTDPDYRGPSRYQVAFDVDDFIQNGFPDEVPQEEKDQVIALYDGGVRQFDDHVGEVLRHLRDTGLDRNTIVVVTSDHGEDLYDAGTTLGHGTNFFGGDQSTRIPMMIRLPGGQLGGRRVPSVVRNVDFMPTILELVAAGGRARGAIAGPEAPPMDGRSVLPLMQGQDLDLEIAAFAETCYLFFPKRLHGEDVLRLAPADTTLRIAPEFRNLFVLKDEWHEPVLRSKDRMLRTNRWKLLMIPGRTGPIWRLYDMSCDPEQQLDISGLELPWVPLDAMKETLLHWVETGEDLPWSRDSDLRS